MRFSKDVLNHISNAVAQDKSHYIIWFNPIDSSKLLVELYVYKYIDRDKYLELYDYLYSFYIKNEYDVTPYILEYKGELIERIP